MQNLKRMIIIILIIMLVLLSILLVIYNNQEKEQLIDETDKISTEIERLEDRNTFFTISSCINKYFNYVYKNDNDAVYKILDDEYKEIMNITTNNVMNKIENYDLPQSFSAKKIYMYQENFEVRRYFIFGTIKSDEMDEKGNEEDILMTVRLDYSNYTYTIMPNGYMFSKTIDNINIANNDIRVISCQYIDYIDICEIHLKIRNTMGKKIEINSNNIELEYMDGIKGKLSQEYSQSIENGEEKELILKFANNIKIPKNINCTINSNIINIPIVEN